MKKYKVTLYPAGSGGPSAEAYVDAESFDDAHRRAIRLIRAQFPEIDPEFYDQFVAIEILWKTPSD